MEAIRQAAARRDLSREQARAVMEEILSGAASTHQIGMLLAALRMKGESVEELIGFAQTARAHAAQVRPRLPAEEDLSGTERDALVDTAGTGGDASGTFNISTATALVVAGCGARVAKHGNRSMTSKCGSADVVEGLGIKIDIPPERIAQCIDEVGIGFLFAPAMHQAWKYAQPARKELRTRTIFNMMGPLCNPAGASAQVAGVYAARLTTMLAQALVALGVKRAFVVHGAGGLDEINDWAEGGFPAQGPHPGADFLFSVRLEAGLLALLLPECFHHPDSAHGLQRQAGEQPLAVPRLLGRGADIAAEGDEQKEQQGHISQHDGREAPVDEQHHPRKAGKLDRVDQQFAQAAHEGHHDPSGVVGHPAQHVT